MREAVLRVQCELQRALRAKFAAAKVRVKPDLSKETRTQDKKLSRQLKELQDLAPED